MSEFGAGKQKRAVVLMRPRGLLRAPLQTRCWLIRKRFLEEEQMKPKCEMKLDCSEIQRFTGAPMPPCVQRHRPGCAD
ncbi:Uncharacterized protein DAT39_016093 [Clarias magur]|uniref:Uncharacterized protein n=1 Tax=Clarias magur TaxID=1594786 RepID=A0A8J4UE90_CLAMG|nr:Uncharacterized protein DAT39_016093 [Clarias magur]